MVASAGPVPPRALPDKATGLGCVSVVEVAQVALIPLSLCFLEFSEVDQVDQEVAQERLPRGTPLASIQRAAGKAARLITRQ